MPNYIVSISRVHISESTREALGDSYDVEDGNGSDRDPYLEGTTTYFIIEKVNIMFTNHTLNSSRPRLVPPPPCNIAVYK